MRLQDLSLADKSWYMMLTLPGGTLRGKVKTDLSSGDLLWSDETARQWSEAELAKRHDRSLSSPGGKGKGSGPRCCATSTAPKRPASPD